MNSTEKLEELFTESETSKFLKVPIDTLRHWRKKGNMDGNIPFIKIGKKLVRYRRSDLMEYLNQNIKAG